MRQWTQEIGWGYMDGGCAPLPSLLGLIRATPSPVSLSQGMGWPNSTPHPHHPCLLSPQVPEQGCGPGDKPREELLPPQWPAGGSFQFFRTPTNNFHPPACGPVQSLSPCTLHLPPGTAGIPGRQFPARAWGPSSSMLPRLQPQPFTSPLTARWGLEAAICATPCGQRQVRRDPVACKLPLEDGAGLKSRLSPLGSGLLH